MKKEATILRMEMKHFNIQHGQYRLRSEKWWEASQNATSLDEREGEVNIEIHETRISACSIIIEGFMHVEQRQRLT